MMVFACSIQSILIIKLQIRDLPSALIKERILPKKFLRLLEKKDYGPGHTFQSQTGILMITGGPISLQKTEM